MKKLYVMKCLCWLLFGFNGLVGCHQDPLLPDSAIPTTCRIYQLVNIDEGVRDTTLYAYNNFGLIDKTTYRRWANGQLVTKIDQDFTYTVDHYLLTQIDRTTTRTASGNLTQQNKGYTYAYKDGRVDQVAIIDNSFGTKLGFRQYTYEGDKLRTYVETDGNTTLVKRYTFDGSGKLSAYEEPGVTSTLSNGKIVKRVYSNGITTSYTYDTEGQLSTQVTTSSTGVLETNYSYDNRPYWNKTQLSLRGIPAPDLGEHVQQHNLFSYSYKQSQNGQITSQRSFSYKHDYNKVGYSQGFSRSDGARQITYYSNCL